MALLSRKPILIVGIGLSSALWLWDSFEESIAAVGELSVIGAIALGSGFWWLQKKIKTKQNTVQTRSPIERTTAEAAIAKTQTAIAQLQTEAPEIDLCELQQKIDRLPELLNRHHLSIAIAGEQGVGKSSIKKILEDLNIAEDLEFIETETRSRETDTLNSDLVLSIVTGDLTDSEWQIIQKCQQAHQSLLLIFNKQDQYIPTERDFILQQLQFRVRDTIVPENVVAIAAAPSEIKVRKHKEDGSIEELIEQQPITIDCLVDRLIDVTTNQREQLVYATTWRKAIELQTETKTIFNSVRRDRAIPIVEQYQYIAAAAAFANPVAALDLLATAAINAQMLVDLGAIYQQQFSLSQAQNVAGTIGKLMVKLGLVELSTQAIGTILKGNAITYLAGGAVQGVSAAYLTRLAGLSLIEYFQEQEIDLNRDRGFNLERLGDKLKQVFQENQRGMFLQNFVKQAVVRLLPESKQPETIPSPSI